MPNIDRGPPTNKYAVGIPLAIQYLQDGSVPIFWGDNQILISPGVYSKPSGMTGNSSLSIPEVVRFIYQWGDQVPLAAMHAETCNGQTTDPGSGSECTAGQPSPGTGSTIRAQFSNGALFNANQGASSTQLTVVLGETPSGGYNGGLDNSLVYYDSVPASATIVVYGISNYQQALQNQNIPFNYFIYYTGPMCPYFQGTITPPLGNGSMIEDQQNYLLPIFYTNLCCTTSTPPPPPPPPPPSQAGCGDCGGGTNVPGSIANPYKQVLLDLDALYAKDYLYGQPYTGSFSDILIPPASWTDKSGTVYSTLDVIFGPKILNIFIVQQPIGWEVDPSSPTGEYEFSWGSVSSTYTNGLTAAFQNWAKMILKYTHYQTLVWVDLATANQVQKQNPCTDLPAMLMQTATQMQTFCQQTPGFKYMGTLTEQKPASFFQPYIDAFYDNPKYRLT